jgi:hypothetical protein
MAKRTKVPIGLRLSPELIERIDGARGKTTRTAWIEGACTMVLDLGGRFVPASPVVERAAPVGDTAADWSMDRQAKLNEAKARRSR